MKKKIIITTIIAVCLIGVVGGITAVAGNLGYNQTPMPEIVEPHKRVLTEGEREQAEAQIKAEDDERYLYYFEIRKNMDMYQVSDPDDDLEETVKGIKLSSSARMDVEYENLGKIIDIVAKAGYCDPDIYEPIPEGELFDVYGEKGGENTTFHGDQDMICNFTVACCNTLNDQSVELTPVEILRLQEYIKDRFYFWDGGWIIEETSKTIETCELIRKTLPYDPLAD